MESTSPASTSQPPGDSGPENPGWRQILGAVVVGLAALFLMTVPGMDIPHLAAVEASVHDAGPIFDSSQDSSQDTRVRNSQGSPTGDTESENIATPAVARGHVVNQDGHPVANVAIHATSNLPAFAGRGWNTQTDPDGRFVLHALPVGTIFVEVHKEQLGSAFQSVFVAANQGTDLRIVLRPTATVTGTVLLPDGQPASAATVTITGSGIWPSRQIATNAIGQFVVPGIPDGIYELQAHYETWVATPLDGVDLSAGEHRELVLRLHEGMVLNGHVVRARDQTPIANARITLTGDALSMTPRSTLSELDGQFHVSGLQPRSYRMSVSAEGFVAVHAQPISAPFAAFAPTHTEEPVVIELRAAATLEGRVVDPRGFPISDVHLSVLGTGEDGSPIQFSGGSTEFRTRVFALQQTGGLPLSTTGELGVTLGQVPPIAMSPASTPTESTESDILAEPSREHGQPAVPAYGGQFATDALGRFRITGVPPGEMQIVARTPAHAVTRSQPLMVAAGSHQRDIEITLVPSGSIQGRVVDARGFPIGNVPVEMLSEDDTPPITLRTSPSGEFSFDDATGHLVLTARPTNLPATATTVDVASGEAAHVELVVNTELTVLRGRTVDVRGFPIAEVRVNLRSLRAETPIRRWIMSSADGTFTLSGLPAPPYRVTVEHPEYARTQSTIRDTESEAEVTLHAGASVRGQVVNERNQQPLEGVSLRLMLPEEPGALQHQSSTDAEGRFSFSRISAGPYMLQIEHPTYVNAELSVNLLPGSQGLDDLNLDPIELVAGASLSGTITDSIGDPVSGAEVLVYPSGQAPPSWNEAHRTNARGTFHVDGLPASLVMVTARHPAAGQASLHHAEQIRVGEEVRDVVVALPARLNPEVTQGSRRIRTGIPLLLDFQCNQGVISAVLPHTRASRAGIRRGDILVSVDNERPLSGSQADAMLRGPEGHEAILVIRRGRHEHRLVIPRERYREIGQPPDLPAMICSEP